MGCEHEIEGSDTVSTTYRNNVSKGVRVLTQELEDYLPFWQRSETLPKQNITIIPG